MNQELANKYFFEELEKYPEGLTADQILDRWEDAPGKNRVLRLLKGCIDGNPDKIKRERIGQRGPYRYYIPPQKNRTDDVMRNSERYYDPTAGKAILNMDKHDGIAPGAIYETVQGSDFLVLRTYPDTIVGYNILDVPSAVSTDSSVAWKRGPRTAMIHVNRVTSISSRKLKLSTFSRVPFETMREVLRKSPFNAARVVEVEVEKPVEVIKEVIKEVEVPVEVIKEVEVVKEIPVEVVKESDSSAIDLALALQKADIYERIVNLLLRPENQH